MKKTLSPEKIKKSKKIYKIFMLFTFPVFVGLMITYIIGNQPNITYIVQTPNNSTTPALNNTLNENKKLNELKEMNLN